MDEMMTLYIEIERNLTRKLFLKTSGISQAEMEAFLKKGKVSRIMKEIEESRKEGERFMTKDIMKALEPAMELICPTPQQGWPSYAYNYVLGELFPEKNSLTDIGKYYKGTLLTLGILQAVYAYERMLVDFDPTYDFIFLTEDEISEGGYNEEYLTLLKLINLNYLYEFMRIGTVISNYNTLGHIAGVHFVAMDAARQLKDLGVPLDLGLVSGAAAGHDIGKYGCRVSEERRIPYLHYYYTELCFERFGMPTIGHIASNHSTWDLELENLPIEALLLIYADFRVKSIRDSKGKEIVKFYSLKESFDVILSKLDNMDEEKENRYRRVYNKLRDFEEYMISLGVDTTLPMPAHPVPDAPKPVVKKDIALMTGEEILAEFKYQAVEHNIKLMNKFYSETEFGSLLETARSEKQWKNLRTYISILGEYSTYMTEKQKLMTLKFLNELLVHRESDIRNQAADIIGQIIPRFNEEYKKELPSGVLLPAKSITNLSLWRETVENLLKPDHKLTKQHKRWSENCLKSIVGAVLKGVREEEKEAYMEVLTPWYEKTDLTEENREALIRVALDLNPQLCGEKHSKRILDFAEALEKEGAQEMLVASAVIRNHFLPEDDEIYEEKLKDCLGMMGTGKLSRKVLSDMYLDNLKASTPWLIKIANISLMLSSLGENADNGQILHIATHLGNLVKVSETVTVRKAAGNGLISIIGRMPLEQRNEIAIEVGKGLEIGDYQFSKYIPAYLGIIMLSLPPRELDELINDFEKLLDNSPAQVGSAVLNTFGVILDNYGGYRELFAEMESPEASESRRFKLLGKILSGFSNYVEAISQEALWVLGMNIFGSKTLSLEDKHDLFVNSAKKLLSLYESRQDKELAFFNEAAALNQIYRFISQYQLQVGAFEMPTEEKIAFFPGTFDPFSLSHKAIATEIRDMGFTVYLAVDEFSWSKKTQPHLHRRKILSMSVADESNIYIFPAEIPVNIANPGDIKRLKEIFRGEELYFVAGSDVVENASCYRMTPEEDSIHSLNHIIFKRYSDEQLTDFIGQETYPIKGEVIYLKLEEYYEDISSTGIRENIDLNRDISNLIDQVAQNYIYEKRLYLREPAYKHVLQAHEMTLEEYDDRKASIVFDLEAELESRGYRIDKIKEYLDKDGVMTLALRDGYAGNRIVALIAVEKVESIDLLTVFGNSEIASHIRAQAAGSIAVIGGLYYSKETSIGNVSQTILVELLSKLSAKDYTYVVYNPCEEAGRNRRTVEIFTKQGFVNISGEEENPVYAVDMKAPLVVFKNIDTMIKNPLNKNPKVLKALETAHDNLLEILRSIYPGAGILSYNSDIMHNKMIGILTKLNGVSHIPAFPKRNGPYMAVPFGKPMENVVAPNTVTKALHTEKYFSKDVESFEIEESSYYSTVENQIRTIKSFNRPVILIDELLHKGYRMNKLDPMLTENQVEVVETVVGVLTGRGRDLMTMKNRRVESAYFLPNMRCWFDESATYPYIGGDSMKDKDSPVSRQTHIPSLNLVLPYTVPTFFGNISGEKLYRYSMTCLENARDILKTLEEEYQNLFEQKLTLARLGEVVANPKRPEIGDALEYNENIAASDYVEKDIERLIRMRKMFRW